MKDAVRLDEIIILIRVDCCSMNVVLDMFSLLLVIARLNEFGALFDWLERFSLFGYLEEFCVVAGSSAIVLSDCSMIGSQIR